MICILWRRGSIAAAAAALAGLSGTAAAEEAHVEAPLVGLSLEELSQIEVTSVSKRPEPVSQAASPVIT